VIGTKANRRICIFPWQSSNLKLSSNSPKFPELLFQPKLHNLHPTTSISFNSHIISQSLTSPPHHPKCLDHAEDEVPHPDQPSPQLVPQLPLNPKPVLRQQLLPPPLRRLLPQLLNKGPVYSGRWHLQPRKKHHL
jgi:hypothetical protein